MTCDGDPCHDSWHLTITRTISRPLNTHIHGPASPHHRDKCSGDDPLIVDSPGSLHYQGPGLRCRMISLSCLSCHMSDMSHCDRSLSEGNYVKCPHKNPSWGESRGPGWCWLGLSVTVITHTHNTEMNSGQANICPCVLSSLICAVLWHNHLTCESGHCERNNWCHPALSHK